MKKKSLNVKKAVHKKILLNLKNKKISNIYTKFKKNFIKLKFFSNLSVAVSGGPDSMALAFFIKCYSIQTNKKAFFYHVDHGLRAQSSQEAKIIKKKLSKFDIKLKVITWVGKKPKKNIQAKARNKRYELLSKNLKKNRLDSIFLGHTRNDLIENFFIRLFRGSGLDGFVSFNSLEAKLNGINILRPLLDIKKSDLEFVSKSVFGNFLEDPSNLNSMFKRVKVRNLIDEISDEGFDLKKIKLTINNLTEANNAIKFFVNKNISENTKKIKRKNSLLISPLFFNVPLEVSLRSLTKILSKFSSKLYPPRGKKVVRVLQNIKDKKFKKTTLHGCVIEKIGNITLIYRENP